jgi:hypothetical protein
VHIKYGVPFAAGAFGDGGSASAFLHSNGNSSDAGAYAESMTAGRTSQALYAAAAVAIQAATAAAAAAGSAMLTATVLSVVSHSVRTGFNRVRAIKAAAARRQQALMLPGTMDRAQAKQPQQQQKQKQQKQQKQRTTTGSLKLAKSPQQQRTPQPDSMFDEVMAQSPAELEDEHDMAKLISGRVSSCPEICCTVQ